MLNTTTSTKDLCSKYNEAENTLSAVQALTESIKADVLDELSARNPAASCAFLRAVARGDSPKLQTFFKE